MMLDAEALRAKLNRFYDHGISLREIALKCKVHDNAISSFRNGSRWGKDRLARLAEALEALETENPALKEVQDGHQGE